MSSGGGGGGGVGDLLHTKLSTLDPLNMQRFRGEGGEGEERRRVTLITENFFLFVKIMKQSLTTT